MTWEYLAGFFDGEGSVTYNGKGFRIIIAQADLKVLEETKKFVGLGFIFKNKKRQSHWKESWVYYIAKQEDVLFFLEKIKDLLIVKKDSVEFRLPEIRKKAEKIKNRKEKITNRIKEVKRLRKEGLTYREIGKRVGMDFGHARRLVLK